MYNVIFLGPPGCGKGTQSALIKKQLNFATISTGELLRNVAKESTPFAIKIKSMLDAGHLVNDEIVAQLIENFYLNKDSYSGCILDGFPRNIAQAQMLESILAGHKLSVNKVIYFDLAQDTLIKRITGRYTCKNCGAIYNKFFSSTKVDNECDICQSHDFIIRSDDNEETVKERLEVYNASTQPLLDYYSELLFTIDASLPQDVVTAQIKKLIAV